MVWKRALLTTSTIHRTVDSFHLKYSNDLTNLIWQCFRIINMYIINIYINMYIIRKHCQIGFVRSLLYFR